MIDIIIGFVFIYRNMYNDDAVAILNWQSVRERIIVEGDHYYCICMYTNIYIKVLFE